MCFTVDKKPKSSRGRSEQVDNYRQPWPGRPGGGGGEDRQHGAAQQCAAPVRPRCLPPRLGRADQASENEKCINGPNLKQLITVSKLNISRAIFNFKLFLTLTKEAVEGPTTKADFDFQLSRSFSETTCRLNFVVKI